jgi:hypothetical protein
LRLFFYRGRCPICKLAPEKSEVVPTADRGGAHQKIVTEKRVCIHLPDSDLFRTPCPKETNFRNTSESADWKEKLAEEKAAFAKFRKIADTKIRDPNLEIDHLSIANEKLRKSVSACAEENEHPRERKSVRAGTRGGSQASFTYPISIYFA